MKIGFGPESLRGMSVAQVEMSNFMVVSKNYYEMLKSSLVMIYRQYNL